MRTLMMILVGIKLFNNLHGMDMDNKERAYCFFRLGEQYTETAKLLLDTLINNGNSNAGVGNTEEEALREKERNVVKSDLYLFIPAIFNCLQSTELFIKGLLLLAGKTFELSHGAETLIEKLGETYQKNSDTYLAIKTFYGNQINIIQEFKEANKLDSSKDLYMSLRYPEIKAWSKGRKEEITVDYTKLLCNGDVGIKQFVVLRDNLEAVKLATVKEYHSRTP